MHLVGTGGGHLQEDGNLDVVELQLGIQLYSAPRLLVDIPLHATTGIVEFYGPAEGSRSPVAESYAAVKAHSYALARAPRATDLRFERIGKGVAELIGVAA